MRAPGTSALLADAECGLGRPTPAGETCALHALSFRAAHADPYRSRLPLLHACAARALVQVDVTLEQSAAAHICIVPPEGRWRGREVVGAGVARSQTVCRRRHRSEQKEGTSGRLDTSATLTPRFDSHGQHRVHGRIACSVCLATRLSTALPFCAPSCAHARRRSDDGKRQGATARFRRRSLTMQPEAPTSPRRPRRTRGRWGVGLGVSRGWRIRAGRDSWS